MSEPTKKSNQYFWLFFSFIIILAVTGTVGNLREYWKMNRLDTEGKRILCPVDSVIKAGGKEEIFVHFTIDGKTYNASKKVKTAIASGDTVPVYYLQSDPAANRISTE